VIRRELRKNKARPTDWSLGFSSCIGFRDPQNQATVSC
jgi:hypothetical protein